ncbi:MAG: hypothetical protein V4691_06855 [Pseudomonadota bacterium]
MGMPEKRDRKLFISAGCGCDAKPLLSAGSEKAGALIIAGNDVFCSRAGKLDARPDIPGGNDEFKIFDSKKDANIHSLQNVNTNSK